MSRLDRINKTNPEGAEGAVGDRPLAPQEATSETTTPRGVMIDLSEIIDPENYAGLAPKIGVKPSELKAEVKKRAIAVLKANLATIHPKAVAVEINRQRQAELEKL